MGFWVLCVCVCVHVVCRKISLLIRLTYNENFSDVAIRCNAVDLQATKKSLSMQEDRNFTRVVP